MEEQKDLMAGFNIEVTPDFDIIIKSASKVKDGDKDFYEGKNDLEVKVKLYKIAEEVVKKTDNTLDDVFLSSLKGFLKLLPQIKYEKKFEK